VNTKENKSG